MTTLLTDMSDRQLVVFNHTAHGSNVQDISRLTGWPVRTITNELNSVCERLRARNITHAVYMLTRAGLIT